MVYLFHFLQQSMEKLLDCLAFGRPERTYDEEIRSFCLTLHFYSPRAYNFVRSTFDNNLPSISAIRNWYAGINAPPGFESDSFEILGKKAKEFKINNNKSILCNLVFDEMAIRTHSQWNPQKMKFDGFVDLGEKLTSRGILPMAKEALVYLVVGLEEKFKIPVAYFFVNSLDTAQKAFITQKILTKLGEIGVEITSMTLDGLKTNMSMCHALGADFNGDAHIPDPFNENRRIYIFLDPPHMLKLARNCVASRNLIDGKGRKIEWRYFQLLYEAQKNLSWNLGNKLTKAHMQWDKKKMNVQLAGETLSSSVAASMEFLKQESEEFHDVDGTVNYTRIINDIFDVMNSTGRDGVTGFKRPITLETHRELFNRFEEAIDYIKDLRVEGESHTIFSSISKTPFVGFFNNMKNFMKLFRDYVQTDKTKMLVTHRFSQDHIETLFGCIRSMGGFNDNPTVQQFEAAYRKLLIHNNVVCSKKSNCIDIGTKILSISSHRTAKPHNDSAVSESDVDDFIFDGDFESTFHDQLVDGQQNHAIAYRASILEDKIIKAKKPRLIVKCEQCVDAFIENKLMEDRFIRFKSKDSDISQPCKSTFEICKFVDSFLSFFEGKSITFDAALLQILRKIKFESLFTSSDFDTHAENGQKYGHKYDFVKKIVQTYMNMKSVHSAKAITLSKHDEPIRHKFKKIIHELGQ